MVEEQPQELSPEVNAFIDSLIATYEKRISETKKYIDYTSRELIAASGRAAECEDLLGELRKQRKLDTLSIEQIEQLISTQAGSAKVVENPPQGE